MKLVNNLTGIPVTKKVVTMDALKYTGKTLLWTGGLYLVIMFVIGIAQSVNDDRKLIPKEK